MDNNIRELVWESPVAVEIVVADPETVGTHKYLLVARRGSYLMLYLPRVVAYFRRYLNIEISGRQSTKTADSQSGAIEASDDRATDIKVNNWYFEYMGNSLPWNRPIGVLYDQCMSFNRENLIGSVSSSSKEDNSAAESTDGDGSQCKWTLRLRYGGSDTMPLAEPVIDNIKEYWTNQFKEACYIRDGSANAVMNMSKDSSQSLWQSIVEGRSAPDYWKHAGPLIRSRAMRHVPMKIYPPLATTKTGDVLNSSRPIQKLVKRINSTGEPITAGQTLNLLMPEHFPVQSDETGLAYKAILHGVEVPLSAPLIELYEEATYPDGFLHITTIDRKL